MINNEMLWLLKNSLLHQMAQSQPGYAGSKAQIMNDTSFSIMEHTLAQQQDQINADAAEPGLTVNIIRGE